MTAMQSLQHSWLRRKPPLQKPTVKRLDSTKDNLRSCVDRWGDQTSPTPFIIQSPIVKEIETDEPNLPELLRPSVVIPTNVQMKENTLSPTSPQSPLAKKIKLQETSDETAKTKSSKKSDSKSKSGSVQKSKSSSSSSNSDIEPSDSGSTVNNSINAQALKTSPAGKGQQLNGTSKVTSQNEMPSRNSVSLQVLKSSSVVKGQPLNSTSKESADRKTPISNDISPQVLELTSAGKEQQLNTSNVMTENKATAGISSSPQVIKNNRTGKEQQINGTCKSTTENKASWSNSVNPEVLNTSPVGNGKLLNGNFKVKTESKELSYFGDSLNNSIQCLGQLGKYIAPQLTFNGSQILRQENMDSGTNIATNFRDNINTKLGESKSNEKSKGGQSDETQGIKISCQTAVSDSRVKEDKPITTNHTDQIMSSINACLVEPVVHESELVNSMKLNNDDLMSHAQSNLPDNVQNTKAQSTLGPQNGPANKNNGHSENSKDLQPKKMQPITVTYSETKTSSNSPSPQKTVTSPLVPSRDSIIPITVGDWSQSKTLGNNLKEESASAKTVERSKKPAKQLGNNISCLKSIWGSKISANEAKHHPIVKYNRTLSSPASTTAKSRFQGPKPQKLHESEEDSSQIAGSTNCPKVILHRIDVEDADTKNQISSLSTSYNQSSTESRLNVNSAMKNSNNVSNNNKNSSKKPINEWVNEKLLNDRFNIDRRASDISSLVNSDSFYEDNVDCVGSRLAEEISRITDKFCRINDDDDSRGRSNDKSAIIAQERHEKITDLLNGKRRPKYRRLTYLSRDVPVGSPPPPTSLTYYLTNCLTSNSTSPMWPGTGCNFFSAPGTPVGSPRSPSEGSLDTDLIFQMLSQKLKADANLQNNTPPKKTGLINT